MNGPKDDGLSSIFDRLDEIIESAYFTPLALGDALAVQFRVPTLKGLPIETVAGVFQLMDRLDPAHGPEGEPEIAETAHRFFTRLKEEWPEVWERWAAADAEVIVDPVMAFNAVMVTAADAIDEWLAGRGEELDPGRLGGLTAGALAEVMAGFSPARFPDDRALRRFLREESLSAYPEWAAPSVYMDVWAEYVRAVMDRSLRPETKALWPY